MIICLEGVNGCGKSTVAAALALQLRSLLGTSTTVVDPTRITAFGRGLRTAIMDADDLPGAAETLAFVSARLHGAAMLRQRPTGRDVIVLERWAGAVIAYGTVAGTDSLLLRALEATIVAALPVDHTFLIDLPGELAFARLAKLEETNRFETVGADYLEQVRRQYLTWASSSRHVRVLGGTAPAAELGAIIAEHITAAQNHEENEG